MTGFNENKINLDLLKQKRLEERNAREQVVQGFFREDFKTTEATTNSKEAGDASTGTHHGDSWTEYYRNFSEKISKHPEILERLENLSKDRLFVDLGCGGDFIPAINIANRVGAKVYLGVDKFNVCKSVKTIDGVTQYKITDDVTLRSDTLEPQSIIPAVVYREDMLTAVKKIKDNSSVLLFNGMEEELFSFMSREQQEKYFSELAGEIKRIIGKDGYILSTNPKMLTVVGGLKVAKDEEYVKFAKEEYSSGIDLLLLYRIID
jgi:hypothetical protein